MFYFPKLFQEGSSNHEWEIRHGNNDAVPGAGAVAGKSSEEALEYVTGLQDQSPGELAELAAQEFAIGAGGEFAFGV